MAITPLPAAPLPSDSTLQFNTKTFAWVAALEDWTDETNATATAVTASQVAATASASASAASAVQSADQVALAAAQVVLATAQVDLAEDAADASEVSALAAAAATNAVLWVSGTTYSVGSLVFSPLDARIYRRIIAGAGTTDPSLDAVNWIQLVRVVDQDDVGTDPNQIPLNQFLGTMAFQDSIAVNIGGGTLINVTSSGYSIQPAVTAITTAGSTTLTIAQIQTLIATVTQTAAVTLVLPTGTLTDAGVLNGLSAVGTALRWTVINLGSASGAVTMSGGTGHTYVGNATVAIATSARFKTVKTATNTFVTYRIA